MPLLSVVIPVYNEKNTLQKILNKISHVSINKEIVIVDNCSTDGTREILEEIASKGKNGTKVIYHSKNLGKGISVRDGIRAATGEYVVLQDADLEYDPNDYNNLIKPLIDNKADLVLGARFTKCYNGLFMNRIGNKFLTNLINFFYRSQINDYATCYKLAKRSTFNELNLSSKSFDIEVEIVSKALKNELRIAEIPISYYPRNHTQGKKIRWLDGIHAILAIIKFRIKR